GGKTVLAIGDVSQSLRPRAQVLVRVGKVRPLADQANGQSALTPTLADADVEHRGLEPRIGADQEDGVCPLYPGDGRIEEVAGAAKWRVELGAVLAAVDVSRAQTPEQVGKRGHLLGAREISGDGADALRPRPFDFVGNDRQDLVPADRREPAVLANV